MNTSFGATARQQSTLREAFPPGEVIEQLLAISSRLRKDPAMNIALERMNPEVRRAQIERQLRKEVIRELPLPSFEEWIVNNVQSDLF